MNYITLASLFFPGLCGIYLGIKAFRDYRIITFTSNKISIMNVIRISIFFGLSSSLLFFTIIMIAGITDNNYMWSYEKVIGAIFVSAIPGVITIFGSIYQIYTTAKYRDILITKFKNKYKSK